MRDPAVGDVLDGYEITALLARGGMATVWKAIDRESGAMVALKIPHIHYEADVISYERFRREEEAALRLDHPNLLKGFTPRHEKSRVYMVIEYVDGTPLSTLLEDGRPVPTARALDIARQTCDALAYLHAQGIYHRDVKPGNLLLTAAGQVKILDLGIAHVVAARRLTIARLSSTIGTPDYMPPEQMRGRVGDGRVDIYALGTMLYRMLTGVLPYPGDDWGQLLRAKSHESPPPPSAHVPSIDPAVEAIVMKAIQPRPAERYATAVDLLADLRDPSAVQQQVHPEGWQPPRHGRNLRPWAAALVIVVALSGIGWIARLSHRRMQETAAASTRAASEVAGRGMTVRR